MQTYKFYIRGLRCAGCVETISKAVRGLENVESFSLNFLTHAAQVTTSRPLGDIFSTIREKGYEPVARVSSEDERAERTYLRIRTITAALSAIVVMALSMSPLGHMMEPQYNAWTQWALTTLVLFFCGYPFLKTAIKQLRSKTLSMDTLVALGTSAAYFLSLWLWWHQEHLYFETATVIIAVILLGRWLEARSKQKTMHALSSLIQLQAKNVVVLQEGKESVVAIDDVQPGMQILVRPGERVPADGIIIKGASQVDESALTGESMPKEKSPGSTVLAGSLNGDGAFVVSVAKPNESTVLAQMIELVESAQQLKSPLQRTVDVVSARFTLVIVLLAVLTVFAWGLFSSQGWLQGLIAAVTVLVVACPCALGLATPTALVVASGQAAKQGLLVRDPAVWERALLVDTFFFDKTGTITEGRPQVVHIENHSPYSDSVLLQFAATAEKFSEHPLGKMIRDHALYKGIQVGEPEEFVNERGRGIRATVEGKKILLGHQHFLRESGIKLPSEEKLSQQHSGVIFCAIDGEFSGAIFVSDPIKPTASRAVSILKKSGKAVGMLTGDATLIAQDVAARVGIDDVRAGLLPHDKLTIVRQFQEQGHKVAFAGDGVNDAAVLEQADVSFAMSDGSDAALQHATVTVLKGDLLKILKFISLAEQTMKIIHQNLFWAFIYNVVALPLAMFAKMNPMVAAAAMALSSVSVVTNSLRLRGALK